MSGQRQALEPSRLARGEWAWTTRRVPRERARLLLHGNVRPLAGDLLHCRVVGIGRHRSLQLASGRPSTLFVGDEILLAAGARYAPDQFEAYVPEALGPCDLVAAGGICGVVAAKVTGTGAPGDPALVRDAGAIATLDFGDAGRATTFLLDLQDF